MSKKADFYDISSDIWNRKYRYSGGEIFPEENSYEDSCFRVAKSIADNESKKKHWEKKFHDILADYHFLPGGRIIANAGTNRDQVTMFNCYVMNKIEDSIEGIFDTVKDSALTQKQGGGVGYDFSTLRPAGCSIRGCEAESSGPISFMRVLDSTCRTIMSAGQRRGAQMGVMRCDHPDIESFILAKRKNESLQMFNLSVGITDSFIQAVKNNLEWELTFDGVVHKTVHAVELWEMIMKSTYDYAEPGFILIDKINEMNNLYYCEEIRATNPCGEQPLPPFGACLLGSLNLTRFVKSAFSKNASIDFSKIEQVTRVATRMLDNVIDLSKYPLPQQKEEAEAKRRMGIGITGLADLFIMMGIRYGSSESLSLAGNIMKTITYSAYEESVKIAEEKGAFPKFDADRYCTGKFISTLPKELQKSIYEKGIRNSHLTSIAPTGTISLLAGNVSSGLEPVFAYHYTRKIRNNTEGDVSEVDIVDYAYRKYLEHKKKTSIKDSDLPDYFVESSNIKPIEHLNIQAALQEYVDSSISKTINVPSDYPFEDFENIYLQAYEKGLKGCTTFRPSEYITGVLVKKEEKKKEDKNEKFHFPVHLTPRPDELEGMTYKIKTPLSAEALYVTINDIIEDDGTRRPYELFINTKNLQHFSWIVAMTRLISAVFRREPDPSFLVEELKNIYDPNGGYFSDGKYIPSLVADIGRTVETHLEKIGLLDQQKKKKKTSSSTKNNTANNDYMICPQCNEKALISQENCLKCLSCEYSKCG